MKMKNDDIGLILCAFGVVVAIGTFSIPIALGIGFGSVLYFSFYSYRKLRVKIAQLEKNVSNDYKQSEALQSIYNTLDIKHPMPEFRSWAVSPDFAKLLIDIILRYKPKTIVETGSGVSTILSSYSLQESGGGKIISLEHLEEFADKTNNSIKLHNLEEFSNVVFAPLREKLINNEKWLWYDAELNNKIDLLIVDGPPEKIQKNSRYPALPLYYELLSENAIIILDDYIRESEKDIVELWKKEFPNLSFEFIELEKGAVVIKKGYS